MQVECRSSCAVRRERRSGAAARGACTRVQISIGGYSRNPRAYARRGAGELEEADARSGGGGGGERWGPGWTAASHAAFARMLAEAEASAGAKGRDAQPTTDWS